MNAIEFQRRWFVADAHADSLMWNRDLTERSSEGHVDFPRLQEAGIDLQCFTIVTRGFPIIGGFPLFAAYRQWPAAARRGEWRRALWQIDRLADFCSRSAGAVALVRSAKDIDSNRSAGRLSAILGVEGAHALEGDASRVRELFDRGVRFMSLTHLSNNELGGSSFPLLRKKGLTALGREVLDAMVQAGMTVDLAHAAEATLRDILAHERARPFCSHTGVRSAAGNWRNLSDETLRAIAERGGVVGILFATVYLGGRSVDDVVRHIERAVSVIGEDAVALGSDFDGMVPLPDGMRDVCDLHVLTSALLNRIPEARVEKILGGNLRRFFSETLPVG